ncbi:MAG: DUF4136 domain-containing protein [Gammaproteobacteria bacterium]|nr:DUF4136 domain-containing protein [Gammaproteobacteria bacterium]
MALLALLAGCATSVTQDIKIDAEADPKANFSGYSTYTWLGSASIVFDNEGRWEPPQFDADAEIKFLIDRELRNRGMNEDSANPDMFVAFAAGIDMDSLEIKMNPESDLGVLEQVPHGGLAVIMIDADTGFAIWAGTATANIQENPTQETIKKRLDFAVTQMFGKLP